MRKILFTTAITALLLTASSTYAQDASGALSADDFLTETQGGNTQIAAPNEISVSGDVVTAATMQDAANKATELTVKESGYNQDEPAFKLITSKQGGVGAIATGRASYATTARNPDAICLAMRHAYIKAFMEAKRNLTQGFHGLSNEGKTVLVEAMSIIVGNDDTLKNSETDMEEIIRQRVEGFIRGYEVRRVENIPEDSSISVTISVNGRSLGRFSRPVPAVIESADLRTGLTQVFDEIQRGIALPAGARAIMTESGDVSFVGYGSALIADDRDPAMRATLMNNARRIAEARALDSLSGMLNGDAVIWANRMSERHINALKDFEDVFGNDATADQSPEGIKRLAERKTETLTRISTLATTQSIRRGVLPPGLAPRTFRDKDNVWYYAVVVYNPTVTQAATDLATEMMNATLIQPIRSTQSQIRGEDGTLLNTGVARPSGDIQMIPTGSFSDDDDEW